MGGNPPDSPLKEKLVFTRSRFMASDLVAEKLIDSSNSTNCAKLSIFKGHNIMRSTGISQETLR